MTTICISGRLPTARFAPRLASEAPHWSQKLAIILRTVMWIRQSHIRIVYLQKDLGVLIFFLGRSRVIGMKLPGELSVSPLYVLCNRRGVYLQYFIQTLRFYVTLI
jgi:hypothetical protein